jgi:uncharacterized cupredoxin-like copper-binding protein
MPARRQRPADVLVVVVYAVLLALGGVLVAQRPGALPGRVEIRMRYSRFEPAVVTVPAGRPVTFVLRNDDPIDHEWLIGDADMHARHRTGTEPHHASLPTEVSVPAMSTTVTVVTFDGPLSWQFICHLPGHEAYGMVGLLTSR